MDYDKDMIGAPSANREGAVGDTRGRVCSPGQETGDGTHAYSYSFFFSGGFGSGAKALAARATKFECAAAGFCHS